MNREEVLRQVLGAWTEHCDPLRSRIVVFERVRDIPYRYPASRDPLEVLEHVRGSCSGKHYLLGDLLRLLDLPVRPMICRHRFNESLIAFPEPMQRMLRKNEIVDLHDYVQVQVDGEWLDIDATWERGLREYGFPVNEEWDGASSMPLSVVPEDLVVAERDPARLKEEMLSKLTPRQRTLRSEFLQALSCWVEELTAEQQREAGTR